MKLFYRFVLVALLCGFLPLHNISAATVQRGVLDDYFSNDSCAYEECRDYSAYIKPAIAGVGIVALIAVIVVAGRSGSGGQHRPSLEPFALHAH